ATLPILAESFIVANRQRSRTDEAHIAFQHVQKLRQLIDAGAAQDSSDRSDARIVLDLEYGAGDFIKLLQLIDHFLRIGDHSSKFEYAKTPLIDSHPLLKIKDRPLRRDVYQQRDDGKKRSQKKKQDRGKSNVEHP